MVGGEATGRSDVRNRSCVGADVTAQSPDSIVIDGEAGLLLATPLDELLARLPNVPQLVAKNTACWRGYMATWRISDGSLYLDDVVGWVGEDYREVGADVVLPGVELPRRADWVTGSLRIAFGPQVRHVHADFDSTWEREFLYELHAGAVTATRPLAAAAAMGTAGPYRLEAPLMSMLSGGGFGQVIAATDLDGRPLVAKAPRPTGGAEGTEMWNGDVPVHVPARAQARIEGRWVAQSVGMDVTSAVLRAEAEILDRDAGVLLPASLGLWEHEPSGTSVLVMERLEGRQPAIPADVRAVLSAVADAVERGTFDAHGDLKLEHVFIAEDGRVRICDPAPRFEDPGLRAFTPTYNSAGWIGPPADAVACASMLQFLPGGPGPTAAWVDSLRSCVEPPGWANDHRAALAELDKALAGAATSSPTPPGAPTTDPLREQWPSAPQWPTGPTPPPLPPSPPELHEDLVLAPEWALEPPTLVAVNASVDRILIAAVDLMLDAGTVTHPSSATSPEIVDADAAAILDALQAVTGTNRLNEMLYGPDRERQVASRLHGWSWHALGRGREPDSQSGALSSPLPRVAQAEAVAKVWTQTWQAHIDRRRIDVMPTSSTLDDSADDMHFASSELWSAWLEDGTVTVADLLWTAASLVAYVASGRRDQDPEAGGGLATVLDDIGKLLYPGGIKAWSHHAGASVARPERHSFRAFFDPGSGVLLRANDASAIARWDSSVDHFDLPIPLALAQQVDAIVERSYLEIEGIGPEDVPLAPGEDRLLTRAYHETCERLRWALGSAYRIETREHP